MAPIGTAPVDGGLGQGHVKGYPVGGGGQGLEVGAHLVAHIPVGRSAIAAHQHAIHRARAQQLAAAIVSHQGIGHTGAL